MLADDREELDVVAEVLGKFDVCAGDAFDASDVDVCGVDDGSVC